jgi:hypothetical protein
VVLALVAFRGYLISGRRRGSAVFVRIALIVKERSGPLRPFAVVVPFGGLGCDGVNMYQRFTVVKYQKYIIFEKYTDGENTVNAFLRIYREEWLRYSSHGTGCIYSNKGMKWLSLRSRKSLLSVAK